MADTITYTHLPDDPCLTQEQIFRYIDGTLQPSEMHAVEKHLLDCPFCSDAVEGLQLTKNREKIGAGILMVASKHNEKPGDEDQKSPIVLSVFQRRSTWYAIAATLVLIIGVTLVMRLSLSSDSGTESDNLAMHEESARRMMDSIGADSTAALSPGTGAISSAEQKSPAPSGITAQAKEEEIQSPAEAEGPKADRTDVPAANNKVMADEDAPVVVMDAETLDKDKFAEEKNKAEDNQPNRAVSQQAARSSSASESPKEQMTLAKDEQQYKKSSTKNADSKSSAAGTTAPAAPSAMGGAAVQEGNVSDDRADSFSVAQDSTRQEPRLYPNKPTDKDLDLSYENGVKLLESGQATASIVFFDEVLKNPSHRYFEDAQWKKADALIQLNRIEEAKTLLNQIVSKGGKYKTQAVEKLKTL
jgi:hypothetical protein